MNTPVSTPVSTRVKPELYRPSDPAESTELEQVAAVLAPPADAADLVADRVERGGELRRPVTPGVDELATVQRRHQLAPDGLDLG